jgi:hypothetical protein
MCYRAVTTSRNVNSILIYLLCFLVFSLIIKVQENYFLGAITAMGSWALVT